MNSDYISGPERTPRRKALVTNDSHLASDASNLSGKDSPPKGIGDAAIALQLYCRKLPCPERTPRRKALVTSSWISLFR